MDIVYMVRNGDQNEDLRYSLRSIAKNAPEFDKIHIVGYKPRWVSDDVLYYPTSQNSAVSKNRNTTMNLMAAYNIPKISDDFILMNDDFILIRPIQDWNESLNKVKNTLEEQIKEYRKFGVYSKYAKTFEDCLPLIKEISGRNVPYNYEQHFPIIINRSKFNTIFNDIRVINYINSHDIVLKRSLYGNAAGLPFDKQSDDVKIRSGDPNEFTTDWISVFDNYIGNPRKPKLNKFLNNLFPEKCKYEK